MSHDKDALEQRIRERAYALWDADGKPDGTPDEYWYRAHREVTQEGSASPGSLDDQLQDTFPASDPPSVTQPHSADVDWPKEAKAQKAPARKSAAKKPAEAAAKPPAKAKPEKTVPAPKPRARKKDA